MDARIKRTDLEAGKSAGSHANEEAGSHGSYCGVTKKQHEGEHTEMMVEDLENAQFRAELDVAKDPIEKERAPITVPEEPDFSSEDKWEQKTRKNAGHR